MSAFIWHPWNNFGNREKSVCVCIFLVHYGPFPQEVNENSVKLAVWAVSLNFLHDFTLFVVDIYQIRLISLFRHLPDHFHFHGSAVLIPKVNLSLRHMSYKVSLVQIENLSFFSYMNFLLSFLKDQWVVEIMMMMMMIMMVYPTLRSRCFLKRFLRNSRELRSSRACAM